MIKRLIERIAAIEKASNNKLAIFGFSFLAALAIAAGIILYALKKL
jgi:hypothetical protein